MNEQLAAARTLGESAGQAALSRANRCDPEFSDTFMTLLRLFARLRKDKPWTAEDMRLWAYARGLPMAGDARSAGPLIKKAVREGIIRAAGWAPTVSSRGSCRQTYVRAV